MSTLNTALFAFLLIHPTNIKQAWWRSNGRILLSLERILRQDHALAMTVAGMRLRSMTLSNSSDVANGDGFHS